MKKEWLLLIVSVVFSVIIAEIALRIYNPFAFRVKGQSIVLPAHQTWRLNNPNFKKLDKVIIHTKNSLGFRGAEPPKDFDQALSIIAVGGSTTECFYVPDQKDWPNVLGKHLEERYKKVWVNNAGLDGQSTVGHLVLFKDHLVKIRPKIVIFFVGANDIGREDQPNFYENLMLNDRHVSWKDYLAKHSEVFNTFLNIGRVIFGKKAWLGDAAEIDLRTRGHITLAPEEINKRLESVGGAYLTGYKDRLRALVRLARANGIDPILATQPALLGKGKDPVTGVDLATIQLGSDNGLMYWTMFEMYNDVTRSVAREENVFLVDMAQQLPKSSAFFYDTLHFTNEGSEAVGKILAKELPKYLDQHYASFKKEKEKTAAGL